MSCPGFGVLANSFKCFDYQTNQIKFQFASKCILSTTLGVSMHFSSKIRLANPSPDPNILGLVGLGFREQVLGRTKSRLAWVRVRVVLHLVTSRQ